jgi:hypothetical protein
MDLNGENLILIMIILNWSWCVMSKSFWNLFIVPARKYTLSELLHLDVCLPALFMPSRMGTVYSPKASLYFHPSGNMVSNDGLSAHSDRKLHVVHVRVYELIIYNININIYH